MKVYFVKWKMILLAAAMVWGLFSYNVQAEENRSHCYPTEEQIQAYKEEGTWEERKAYVEKLNHSTPSEGLLYNAIQRENGISAYGLRRAVPEVWKGMQVTGDAKILSPASGGLQRGKLKNGEGLGLQNRLLESCLRGLEQ